MEWWSINLAAAMEAPYGYLAPGTLAACLLPSEDARAAAIVLLSPAQQRAGRRRRRHSTAPGAGIARARMAALAAADMGDADTEDDGWGDAWDDPGDDPALGMDVDGDADLGLGDDHSGASSGASSPRQDATAAPDDVGPHADTDAHFDLDARVPEISELEIELALALDMVRGGAVRFATYAPDGRPVAAVALAAFPEPAPPASPDGSPVADAAPFGFEWPPSPAAAAAAGLPDYYAGARRVVPPYALRAAAAP